MQLNELSDLLLSTASAGSLGLKNRKFAYKKFEPTNMFKPISTLELSYSTVNQFKECMVKFAIRKFLDIGFFKTNEALFLGNVVHKFIEEMINEYVSGYISFENYNIVAKKSYDSIISKFNKEQYPTGDIFNENIFKYVFGRKKFEPDVFFDDISYISGIYGHKNNYAESKKVYFQNAAKLLKQLFGIASQVNAKNFKAEDWFRFNINDLPVLFIGKMDLYFTFNRNDTDYLAIIDFKTGKKEYFSWDQLHYYALYFGENRFDNIEKYFFDIKEGERYLCRDKVQYKKIYDNLKSSCSEIVEVYKKYEAKLEILQNKYSKKLDALLNKVKTSDDVHKIPCEIVMMIFDFFDKEFFKSLKIENYHANGGFACNFCDYLSFCSIRS